MKDQSEEPNMTGNVAEEQDQSSPSKDQNYSKKIGFIKQLKDSLAMYQNIQSIDQEQLDNLCRKVYQDEKNMDMQPKVQKSSDHKISEEVRPPTYNRVCCIKVKEIIFIGLILLLILLKITTNQNRQFPLGQYILYETKYEPNIKYSPNTEAISINNSFWQWLSPKVNLLVYIPKTLQKQLNYKHIHLSYQKCLNFYAQMCIQYKLNTFGSSNMELQQWVIDQIKGNQHVFMEVSVDYLLTIVLTARIIKQYQLAMSGGGVQLVLGYNQMLGIDCLNGLKLSLIENNCFDVVVFVKNDQSSNFKGEHLKQFDYVFLTPFTFSLHALNKDIVFEQYYSFTNFIIIMPFGVNFIINQKLSYIDSHMFYIRFQEQSDQHYSLQVYKKQQHLQELVKQRFTILAIMAKSKNNVKPLHLFQQTKEIVTDNGHQTQKMHMINGQHLPGPVSELKAHVSEYILQAHECINESKILQLQASDMQQANSKQIMIQALLKLKLLINKQQWPLYRQTGSIHPEILIFLHQNIKQHHLILVQEELLSDPLIVLVTAKQIQQNQKIICLLPDSGGKNMLQKNIKLNHISGKIQFKNIQPNNYQAMNELFDYYNFTMILTSVQYFSIYFDKLYQQNQQKTIIFYWFADQLYLSFMTMLLNKLQVWAITDKLPPSITSQGCQNYQLLRVNSQSINKITNRWIVVKIK